MCEMEKEEEEEALAEPSMTWWSKGRRDGTGRGYFLEGGGEGRRDEKSF